MHGSDAVRGTLFSYVDVEKRVRADYPLRLIRGIVNTTLSGLSGEFDAPYSPHGRESIPPERLLRALLLQASYSIRSERQLVERINSTFCFAGSSAWASAIRCGKRRPSPRTATGCWRATWR